MENMLTLTVNSTHFLEDLRAFYARKDETYLPIRVEKNDLVSPTREQQADIGVRGEILETPGHSADSISLVLDSGVAFIGDQLLPALAGEDQIAGVCQSWKKLLARGATRFYHSHVNLFSAALIQGQLSTYCF